MARTLLRGGAFFVDGSVQRDDLDVSTSGQALLRKLIAGVGISLTSTGADAGTGDVTVNIGTVPQANGGTGGTDDASARVALLIGLKDPVKAAADSNITLSGTQTVDGVSLVAGDRVLVFGQSTAANNGIYVVAAGAWSRATDADSSAKLVNAIVAVLQGTTYKGSILQIWGWVATNTLGTTSMSWVVQIDTNNASALGVQIAGTNVLVVTQTGKLGFGTGAGGTVTQGTSRTTGVTLNKPCGAITLFSAAGSTTAASFVVTNSQVAATDTIIVSQKNGTNLYDLCVTAVGGGNFTITFRTTGGTSTDAPVINFVVIKAVTA